MKIIADENIPFLERFFGDMGELHCLPGREIDAEHVKDADILVVRSVTKVNASLLEQSSLKFVGTCTIGMDHFDIPYLEEKGIAYANAPGSNANSVVEYLLSCLSILSETHDFDLDASTVGIIGYGNIGASLSKRLSKLGVMHKVYDPLVEQAEIELSSFEDVMQCDVVTLHVPMTTTGDYPTYHMINEQVLSVLNAKQTLINASRGAVVDNQALKARLLQDDAPLAILDVWEGEPLIDETLARLVHIGTPHIAGYSFDGKVAGTEMIYRKVCQMLGLPARYSGAQFMEEPPLSRLAFTSTADPEWCIHTAIRACFDVRHDHSQLMKTLLAQSEERGDLFDALRKNYRCRREFSGVKIQLKQGDSELFSAFKALGFNVK